MTTTPTAPVAHHHLAGTWHKANPPFTRAQLADSERSPSWVNEYIAMTGVASNLAFGDTSERLISEHISALFHVSISVENKTMRALTGQVLDVLSVLRPEWFDLTTGELFDDLPDGIDFRSKNEIKTAEDTRLAAERKVKAAEAAVKRREDAKLKLADDLAAAKLELETALAPVVKAALAAASFEEARTMLNEELAGALVQLGITNPLADQVVYAGLPETWTRELSDGTLKLRDALVKVKPTGPNRHQRSMLKTIYAYIDKHGLEDAVATLQRAWPAAVLDTPVMKDILLPDVVLLEGDEPEVISAASH